MNAQIDQIEFNNELSIILKQYQGNNQVLMPFNAHGMKNSVQKQDFSGLINDLENAQMQFNCDQ